MAKKTIGYKLSKLSELRKKADYDPYVDLTPNDVSDAVNHMEQIFNRLKFE
ncbi:MAG: HEPN domain-containing protein [Methanobrevibacter sp.]|nr:HEPN domain-containing protein [Methanobrevibacter sp.]